jgi:hypothetical protein
MDINYDDLDVPTTTDSDPTYPPQREAKNKIAESS